MASASTPSANEPAKDFILVHTVQLKPMIKAQISGRMVSRGDKWCSVRFSILWENPSEEVDDDENDDYKIIIIIVNKSQETTVFSGGQKLTSAMKLMPEKWW